MPKYPDVTITITDNDHHAFYIVARVAEALRCAGVDPKIITEFQDEAIAGMCDKMLQTVMKWVNIE